MYCIYIYVIIYKIVIHDDVLIIVGVRMCCSSQSHLHIAVPVVARLRWPCGLSGTSSEI